MRLELGAGARTADGFVGVDINPYLGAGVVADALALPFAADSVDELRAVDVLEHISYRDTARALGEWARVLRPAGKLYVQVPDAGTIMEWYCRDDDRLRRTVDGGCDVLYGAQWRLLGGHADKAYAPVGDWRWNAHYALFDRRTLNAKLSLWFHVERLGTNGHPNLQAWCVKR